MRVLGVGLRITISMVRVSRTSETNRETPLRTSYYVGFESRENIHKRYQYQQVISFVTLEEFTQILPALNSIHHIVWKVETDCEWQRYEMIETVY